MPRGKQKEILSIIFWKRKRLLPMLYTTKELAEELGVSREYISHSIVMKQRVPIIKDGSRIYINGIDVQNWIESYFMEKKEKKNRNKLSDENEFYCLGCKSHRISNQWNISQKDSKIVKVALCPVCGKLMRKYIKAEK